MARRPPRLPGFDYIGRYRYFVTASTNRRQTAFLDEDFAVFARDQLLRTAARDRFAVSAFCLMPDHVHVLLSGTHDDSAFLPLINRWRQKTGLHWRRRSAMRLWQEGYWDRVLREHEDTLNVAAYIVGNPVRSSLVTSVLDYRWVGSSEYTLQQLVDAIQIRPDGNVADSDDV